MPASWNLDSKRSYLLELWVVVECQFFVFSPHCKHLPWWGKAGTRWSDEGKPRKFSLLVTLCYSAEMVASCLGCNVSLTGLLCICWDVSNLEQTPEPSLEREGSNLSADMILQVHHCTCGNTLQFSFSQFPNCVLPTTGVYFYFSWIIAPFVSVFLE